MTICRQLLRVLLGQKEVKTWVLSRERPIRGLGPMSDVDTETSADAIAAMSLL